MNNINEYDYIVIGGGSAGSIAAAELAENTDKKILLIDAGFSPNGITDVWNPYENNNLYGMKDLWWEGYRSPKYSGSDVMVDVFRSKINGGCSAVNDMVYTRGAPADYDRWENFYGCTGWGYENISAAFDAIENRLQPTIGEKDEFGSAFIVACNNLGIDFVSNYNAGLPLNGVSPLCSTISSEINRETSFKTYAEADDNPPSNLTVLSSTLVSRIILDKDNVATGVEVTTNETIYTINCNCEIILSAGAINSPKILMCSGIGDTNELLKYGISPIIDAPLVGKNLQDAILFSLQWTTSHPLEIPPNAPNGHRRNEGFAIAWTNLNEHKQPRTCIEMMPGLYTAHQPMSVLKNHYTITGGAMRLRSRGWVKLASSDPAVPPDINLNLFDNEHDMEEAVAGFELARKLGNSDAMSSFRGKEIAPGSDLVTYDQIKQWILKNFFSYNHPSGTCKMGPDSGDAVVDPKLKVYGVSNLRVADASIMPEITSGHTQAPSFLIGYKAAEFIIG